MIKKKLGRIEAVIPFSTIRKRSITAVRHPDQEDLIRIYIKGAPEIIVSRCTRTFDLEGDSQTLKDGEIEKIYQEVLHDSITTKGFRGLAIAFKDLTIEEFENLKSQYNNFTTEADREVLERNLTFIAIFAL